MDKRRYESNNKKQYSIKKSQKVKKALTNTKHCGKL